MPERLPGIDQEQLKHALRHMTSQMMGGHKIAQATAGSFQHLPALEKVSGREI